MAINITTFPDDFSPSGNPLIFVFSSDQTAQANFSYKVELYAGGVLKETHKVFPESGAAAHFDASDFAERYTTPPAIDSTDLYDAANYLTDLKLKVIENYGTPPADQLTDEETIKVYKAKLKKRDWLGTWDPADYIFGAGKKWLTLHPRSDKIYIKLDENNKFTYITNEETLRAFVQLRTSAGGLIASGSTANVARDPITVTNITNAILLATYGLSQANIDAAAYIEIYWYDGINESEHLEIWIDDRCESSTTKQVLFLSSIGSLEPYRFTARNKERAKVQGFGLEQQFGYFDDSGNYSFDRGGLTDYVKTMENGVTLLTDWLSQAVYYWLASEIITSPLVYYIDEYGNLLKSRVTTTSYQVLTSESDEIFNLSVELQTEKDSSTIV